MSGASWEKAGNAWAGARYGRDGGNFSLTSRTFYPTAINNAGVAAGSAARTLSNGTNFAFDGTGVLAAGGSFERLTTDGGEELTTTLNNLSNPWVIDITHQLRVKVGGVWTRPQMATWGELDPKKNAEGTVWKVNDRCEMIGSFDNGPDGKLGNLVRNGQVFNLDDLIDGHTVSGGIITINDLGAVLTYVTSKASNTTIPALLLPVEFKEVNPASGFDGETKPHWLMAPQHGANYAKAVTPASSSVKVSFNIRPVGAHENVFPANTTASPETITVIGEDVGDTSKVEVRIGSAAGMNSELNVSVKNYITKTVAIHAVTLKYSTPMPLNAKANPPEGKPNQICIKPKPNATIIGATTPGGDDHQDANSGVIDTGANGVCETDAKPQYDEQVIPKGHGVHIDIVPSNVPTSTALKTYLDQVFGLQTNTYFTVTRSDFAVDYDVNIINSTLDISPLASFRTPEEDAIVSAGASQTEFNVYYVPIFKRKQLQGILLDIALWDRHLLH